MKFTQLAAFEKHLKDSFPDHLAQSYLIMGGDEAERTFLIGKVSDVLKRRSPELEKATFSAESEPFQLFQEQLNSLSLFGPMRYFIVHELEKLTKDQLKLIPSWLYSSFFIFSSKGSSAVQEFYNLCKKEIVAIDLTEEKPWDKKKRLEEFARAFVREEGKELEPQAAVALVERSGNSFALVRSELEKVCLFVAEKKAILLSDLNAISSLEKEETLWATADLLIWHKKRLPLELDNNSIFPLISVLRAHLELGLGFATKNERKSSLYLKPQQLEAYRKQAARLGKEIFADGLIALFELEKRAKSGIGHFELLFDLFAARWVH